MTRFLSAVGVSVLLSTMLSYAQTGQSVSTLDNESTGSWFVELSSQPTVEGTPLATLEREEQAFHAAATGAGIRYTTVRPFQSFRKCRPVV